jgi:hypothetical protein
MNDSSARHRKMLTVAVANEDGFDLDLGSIEVEPKRMELAGLEPATSWVR